MQHPEVSGGQGQLLDDVRGSLSGRVGHGARIAHAHSPRPAPPRRRRPSHASCRNPRRRSRSSPGARAALSPIRTASTTTASLGLSPTPATSSRSPGCQGPGARSRLHGYPPLRAMARLGSLSSWSESGGRDADAILGRHPHDAEGRDPRIDPRQPAPVQPLARRGDRDRRRPGGLVGACRHRLRSPRLTGGPLPEGGSEPDAAAEPRDRRGVRRRDRLPRRRRHDRAGHVRAPGRGLRGPLDRRRDGPRDRAGVEAGRRARRPASGAWCWAAKARAPSHGTATRATSGISSIRATSSSCRGAS